MQPARTGEGGEEGGEVGGGECYLGFGLGWGSLGA
jgi:hypothetical protein